jgi:exodeoxyribonuclease VII large subunit
MSTRHVWSVSDLLGEINGALATYRDLYLEGEVTNFVRSGAGHLYFSLKDEKCQIGAVMFAMWSRHLRFRIENGIKLIVRGRLEIYNVNGKFQIKVDSAEPAGLGALQLAFEQLKTKLAGEGLFDAARKKPLPPLPQRIAVVTSPTGAAVRDVLNVLGRRFANLSIQIYPVRVQGSTAGREIAAALRNLSRWDRHDVVIICRGGGSLEDLWAFNEEIVARAVADCSIPTISGVGHETDFTICDFVADHRAPTPSAAAEIVIRGKDEICAALDHMTERISRFVERQVRGYRHDLRHLSSSDGIGLALSRIREARSRLDRRREQLDRLLRRAAEQLRARLDRCDRPLQEVPARLAIPLKQQRIASLTARAAAATRRNAERRREKLAARVAQLEAVSPLSVLSRGYAIAFSLRGKRPAPLYDSMSVAIGESIEVQLKRGRIECTVDRHSLGLETSWPVPSRMNPEEEDEHGASPQ